VSNDEEIEDAEGEENYEAEGINPDDEADDQAEDEQAPAAEALVEA
jgi:hypothetical protein